MSLDVSPVLLEKAQTGDVREDEFLACIHESLPYAWQLIADLARQLRSGEEPFVDNQIPPPNEHARGQLNLNAKSDDPERFCRGRPTSDRFEGENAAGAHTQEGISGKRTRGGRL